MIHNYQFFDYELDESVSRHLDCILDSSEYYDYELGDNELDYIYFETFVTILPYILTEDGYIISTEDNYLLEYTE